jgi:hypothetical protein
MKELLRTSVWCLFIALALNVAFTQAQESPWLQLNTHNPARNVKLKPEWTVIISSVKPYVKQIRDNCWEISFSP